MKNNHKLIRRPNRTLRGDFELDSALYLGNYGSIIEGTRLIRRTNIGDKDSYESTTNFKKGERAIIRNGLIIKI